MTKDSLAAQLRHRGICRGDFSMIDTEDDEVLVKPSIVFEVKFTEWTQDDRLR